MNKRKNIICILISIVAFSNIAIAKDPPTVAANEMKAKYFEATEAFYFEYYVDALPLFKPLLATEPKNSNLNFYMGVCILKGRGNRIESIPYLEKAIKKTDIAYNSTVKGDAAPVFAYSFLAQAYMLDLRFDDALVKLNKFKSYLTENVKDAKFMAEANKLIDQCENGKKMVAKPVPVSMKSLAILNSPFNEYNPVLSSDGNIIYFSSKRKGTGTERDNSAQYAEDVYTSVFKAGKWAKPKKMAGKFNTKFGDVVTSISPDGGTLYMYRSSQKGSADIYMCARTKKGKWLAPQKLESPVNTSANETNAFITKDGNTLFFVSDRPEGYGGLDIYMSEKLSSGEWGTPINLGPTINTINNEDTPYMLGDGVTLNFCSDGHGSIGGYDIFEATLSDEGTWSEPENLGYPINTPNDEYSYFPLPDGNKAYMSAPKAKGSGDLDIWEINFDVPSKEGKK